MSVTGCCCKGLNNPSPVRVLPFPPRGPQEAFDMLPTFLATRLTVRGKRGSVGSSGGRGRPPGGAA